MEHIAKTIKKSLKIAQEFLFETCELSAFNKIFFPQFVNFKVFGGPLEGMTSFVDIQQTNNDYLESSKCCFFRLLVFFACFFVSLEAISQYPDRLIGSNKVFRLEALLIVD
jgi:hypothetical protein